MNKAEIKKLSAKFRGISDDHAAVGKLADETTKANANDNACASLCNRFKAAANGDEVRAICDEVDAN